mgnify:CR=1 FL=1
MKKQNVLARLLKKVFKRYGLAIVIVFNMLLLGRLFVVYRARYSNKD